MALIIHNRAFNQNSCSIGSLDLIGKSIASGKVDYFILLVPTGRLTRHLQYKIINEYFEVNQKPCGDINIYNLAKFAELCFKNSFQSNKYRILSDSYRMEITEEAVSNSDLEFYGNKGKKLNFHVLETLANIIYGLREDGITYSQMEEELNSINENNSAIKDRKKFSDIAKILISYEKLLENRYLDPPALLNLLNNFADNFNLNNPTVNKSAFDDAVNPQDKIKQILVYGFSDFKNPEVNFLSKFAQSSIPVSIHLDFSEINGPLFGNLKEMKETLLTAGFDFFYTDEEYTSAAALHPTEEELRRDYKYFLRRWLFNVEREIKFPGLCDIVRIFEFETTEQEVRQICKLIKHLISQKGYSASEIAVVSRDSHKYAPLFREMFYIERIPANFSDRYPLAESQVVIAILAAIDTVANDFKRNDVIKTLESRFININNTDVGQINLSNLIQTANQLRFPRNNFKLSKSFWLKRIGNAVDYLKTLSETMESESASKMDLSNINQRLENYKNALSDFKLFADALPEKKKEYSPDEFKNMIVNGIIGNFGLQETITQIYKETENAFKDKSKAEYDRQIESVEKFSRALGEFLRILDEMTFILNDRGRKKILLTDLISQLKLSVSAAKYQTREKTNYGVTVTALEQIREIPFKVTILAGMNDGEFPMPYRPASFLGKELADSEDRHLHSEQIQFYQYLINGADEISPDEKKIYLTYTKYRQQYESTRSAFIDSLLKVTDLEDKKCLVQFSSSADNTELTKPYPWLNSVSNRLEIAEIFGEIHSRNGDIQNELLVQIQTNDEILTTGKYTDLLFQRFHTYTGSGLSYLDENAQEFLSKMPEQVYSATDFETYSKCSFIYFSKKLLKLNEKEEEGDLVNPLDFGNIMHSALYKFYIRLQKDSSEQWLQPENPHNLSLPELKPVKILNLDKRALTLLLMEIISAEFDDVKLDHPFIKLQKREILGSDELLGWAEHFIDSEFDRIQKFDSYPSLFEFEFGFDKSFSGIRAIDIGENIFLRGKIDRLEIGQMNVAGNNGSEFRFTTVDYKSSDSGTSTNRDIEKGVSFQMPLYSIAMKKILEEYYGINSELKGGAFYILKPKIIKGKKNDTKIVLMPKEELKEFKGSSALENYEQQAIYLENSVKHAKEIIANIVRGKFAAEPLSLSICQYCNFGPVCRINERAIVMGEEDEGENYI